MKSLDVNNPATWGNSAAPSVNVLIQEQLTKLGGLVPDGNGENSGKPILKLVWGQSEQIFIGGANRIRFQDSRIPISAPYTQKYRAFAVRKSVLSRLYGKLAVEAHKRRDAFLSCDWEAAAKPVSVADCLAEHFAAFDFHKLDTSSTANTRDLINLGLLLPPDYEIVYDGFDYLPVGRQCFYVVEWLPAKVLCSLENWEPERYGTAYSPENNDERFLDILGAYPRHGLWDNVVLQIADNVDGLNYEYATPSEANCLEPVRQMLQSRERLSKQEKNKTFAANAWLEAENDRLATLEAKTRASYQELADDALPVGKYNPTSVPTIMVKSKNTVKIND